MEAGRAERACGSGDGGVLDEALNEIDISGTAGLRKLLEEAGGVAFGSSEA